jgi:hypothetical protein
VSGKTKEEARKALREARSGADQGLVFDAARLTVAEYLDCWLKDSVQGSVRGAPTSPTAARRGAA